MEAGEPLARRAIIDLPGHGLGLPGAKPGLASSQLRQRLSRSGNRPDTALYPDNPADQEGIEAQPVAEPRPSILSARKGGSNAQRVDLVTAVTFDVTIGSVLRIAGDANRS